MGSKFGGARNRAQTETTFYCWRVESSLKLVQLTDWLLVALALLLIGLTKISIAKNCMVLTVKEEINRLSDYQLRSGQICRFKNGGMRK
jgi:hypothetical protein